MNKISLEGQYEYYRCIHHDFNSAYKMINDYVTDLYVLPKKLIDSNGPVLNKFITDYSFTKAKGSTATSYEFILEFIHQLDEFAEETQNLFKEHKIHSDKSKVYLRKVAELNERCTGRMVSEYAVEYVNLTPELTALHEGLKRIKAKADDMVDKLEKLELRWKNLAVQARA